MLTRVATIASRTPGSTVTVGTTVATTGMAITKTWTRL
jgi:hypothetical protein